MDNVQTVGKKTLAQSSGQFNHLASLAKWLSVRL